MRKLTPLANLHHMSLHMICALTPTTNAKLTEVYVKYWKRRERQRVGQKSTAIVCVGVDYNAALTIIYFSSDSAPPNTTPDYDCLGVSAYWCIYAHMCRCMGANDKQIKIENAIDKLAGDVHTTEI